MNEKKYAIHLYVEERWSADRVATHMGRGATTIRRWVKQAGYDLRGWSHQRLIDMRAPEWKFNSCKWFAHPTCTNIWATLDGKVGRVYTDIVFGLHISYDSDSYGRIKPEKRNEVVHRIIYECCTGRELKSDEHVHHIDHNPANNHFDNFALMSRAEHTAHHRK